MAGEYQNGASLLLNLRHDHGDHGHGRDVHERGHDVHARAYDHGRVHVRDRVYCSCSCL